jgi:hypothetical protein
MDDTGSVYANLAAFYAIMQIDVFGRNTISNACHAPDPLGL